MHAGLECYPFAMGNLFVACRPWCSLLSEGATPLKINESKKGVSSYFLPGNMCIVRMSVIWKFCWKILTITWHFHCCVQFSGGRFLLWPASRRIFPYFPHRSSKVETLRILIKRLLYQSFCSLSIKKVSGFFYKLNLFLFSPFSISFLFLLPIHRRSKYPLNLFELRMGMHMTLLTRCQIRTPTNKSIGRVYAFQLIDDNSCMIIEYCQAVVRTMASCARLTPLVLLANF